MFDQTLGFNAELILDGVIHDATALFEQYEPANEAEQPAADGVAGRGMPEAACENLYATPW
ncbi:MAG: hypothetical protein RIC56_20380 [Pseudomonadales bacterium]